VARPGDETLMETPQVTKPQKAELWQAIVIASAQPLEIVMGGKRVRHPGIG